MIIFLGGLIEELRDELAPPFLMYCTLRSTEGVNEGLIDEVQFIISWGF